MTGKTHNITILPSGRRINANFGIIGITTNGPIHLGEGADGNPNFVQLRAEVEEHYMEPESYDHAPLSDKIALGQLMISRWQQYIDAARAEAADNKLTAKQADVLRIMYEENQAEWTSSFRTLAVTLGKRENDIRLVVRQLKRKGLARQVPFVDDDGYLRGSGYDLTAAGIAVGKKLFGDQA